MAARELNLFTDIDQGRLVQGFDSTLQANSPRFVFGDSVPISFRALTQNTVDSSGPWSEMDLTGKTVRIAIGTPAGFPTAGTFTLTYGGDTTAAIAYNADATAIAAALNALASIASAGGVTVTKASSGIVRVIFTTAGSRTAITAGTQSLYPSTAANIAVALDGDGSTREVVTIRLETQPAAYAELSDDLPAAAATVTEIRAGDVGVGAINSFELTTIPLSGVFALEIGAELTDGIAWDASSATVQAAVEALPGIGTGNVTVTGSSPLYTLSFAASLGDIGAVTYDLTGIVVPSGRAGSLDTNTAQMIELLNGSAQASAKLEIEILTIADGTTWTVLQTECTVADDLISNSPPSEAGGPIYITETTLAAIIPQFVDSTAANAVVSVGDAWWDTTLDRVRVRLS